MPYPRKWIVPKTPIVRERLPPPPVLQSPVLAARVPMNKILVNKDEAAKHGDGAIYWMEMQSNKQLEILGDAYIKAAWLHALSDEFPELTASALHVRSLAFGKPT